MSDLRPGSVLGDYQVIDVLGAGGMGKVYKVRNTISDRVEAMKVLLPNLESDPDLADRFLREIKVQASLSHPNIASLHTAQRVGNQLIMFMEFVEGVTLEQLMRQGRIPIRDGVEYVSQVLAALAYAHQHGVIHRDIKPANMMLTRQGVIKLMDFGIARMAVDRRLTQTGRTLGSLFYMSPEQINGSAALDARSDLYSVGISLYEIITGTRPFQGDSDYSIMAAHLQQMPVAPIQLDPHVPAGLNEIILMSIAKDPAQRFQTADAFRAALSNVPAGVGAPAAAAGAATMVFSSVPAAAAQQGPGPVPGSVPGAVPGPVPGGPQPGGPLPGGPVPRPAPVSGGKGHRGLYMVAGSLATVAVLALAAVQIPKLLKTRASTHGSVPAAAAAVSTAQSTAAPEAKPPSADASAPAPAPVVNTPPVQAVELSPAPRQDTGGRVAQTRAIAQTPAHRPAQAGGGPAASLGNSSPQQTPVAQTTTVQQTTAAQQPGAQQTAAPVQAAGPDPAVAKELGELRHRQTLMAARLGGVQTSIQRLQAEQNRMGLGISPEITSGQHRLEYHMDEAERAIKAGDAATAREKLEAAERELERLESRFGR